MDSIKKEKEMNGLKFLTLKEVGELIYLKDMESIKRWLTDNKITIYKLVKLNYVYSVDVECVITLPHVKSFKKEYPQQWESYYRQIIKDDALYNMIMLKLEVEISNKPLAKVKLRSQSDEKLYNRLTR